MSSSESSKRRGATAGGSSSHVLRTTSTTSKSSSPNRNSIIAPPPRAALGSGSNSSGGPGQDEPSSSSLHGANGGAGVGASSSSSKDTISTSSAASAAVAAAAAATQLVKEKDLRISQLERELSVMEAEFTRELDKLSQNESETASFWQAKHSALHQQFLRADTELRLLRAEVELREAERDELRAGWETLRRDMAARDDEARELRAQVKGLKEWVSTSTRSDGHTSDEVFADGMARLGNGLQNWVITHFRRSKLDLSSANASAKDELARLVPMYEELVHTAKVHLLQSLVSRLLVELVFDAYFIGLSEEQARQFTQMETLISSFAGSAEEINQWRSQTLSILKKDASLQKMATETSQTVDDVVTRVNSLLEAITTDSGLQTQRGPGGGGGSSNSPRSSSSTATPDPRTQSLRALVASAIELSRLLVSQKAVFTVFFPEILPHQRVVFDKTTMEDMGGEEFDDDDDDNVGGDDNGGGGGGGGAGVAGATGLARREICCVTFPGIIKRGDETGGQLQFRNVIAKARVLSVHE